MSKSYAVIGAGYGDEGKGLMVDYLTAQAQEAGQEVIVVKHNGGAQAAHTVVLGDVRHIHKHLGSGTLRGASTMLSGDFIANPMIFKSELQALGEVGISIPTVYCDPETRISLPIDMIVNQILEMNRGIKRHGSCGWGINETVVRSVDPLVTIRAKDLFALTLDRLIWIKRNYLRARLLELGILDQVTDTFKAIMDDDRIDVQFLEDCKFFHGKIEIMDEDESYGSSETFIFETGQGLGLDQRHGHFPHVTRSNTGLGNAKAMARRLGIKEMEVVYVTRAYATRHGAGPLECENMEHYAVVEDETNVEGPWQGELRTAPLFIESVRDRIHGDYARHGKKFEPNVETTLSLAVTCLDQIAEGTTMFHKRSLVSTDADTLFGTLVDEIKPTGRVFASRGPTAEHVGEISLTTEKEKEVQL